MSALVFEYSGHGESPMDVMQTRPAQHFLEVICVFDWLKQQHPNTRITVMGTSYGGYMATVLMAYRTFDRLILRIPAIYRPIDFYSLNGEVNSDEAWDATANYRSDKAAIADHPFLKNVSKFLGPRLVVVHEKDEQVPVETTDAFIEALHAGVYLAKDFVHSTGAMPPDKIVQYQNAICDWLNTTR